MCSLFELVGSLTELESFLFELVSSLIELVSAQFENCELTYWIEELFNAIREFKKELVRSLIYIHRELFEFESSLF